jgi:hypothetical protein
LAFRLGLPKGSEGLKKVLEEALSFDATASIEVAIEKGSEKSPWLFIHPDVPVEHQPAKDKSTSSNHP